MKIYSKLNEFKVVHSVLRQSAGDHIYGYEVGFGPSHKPYLHRYRFHSSGNKESISHEYIRITGEHYEALADIWGPGDPTYETVDSVVQAIIVEE